MRPSIVPHPAPLEAANSEKLAADMRRIAAGGDVDRNLDAGMTSH